MNIGTNNQIFIDGLFLDKRNVEIIVQRPHKTEEKNIVSGVYSRDPGQEETCEDGPELRCFSQVMANDGVFQGFDFVSTDGVNWQAATPEFLETGKFLFGVRQCTGTVPFGVAFEDPKATSEPERYKLVSGFQNKVFATSDGREWTEIHTGMFPQEAMFPNGMDSQNIAFYDESLDKYTAYVRVNKLCSVPPQHKQYFDRMMEMFGGKNHLRCVGRSVTDDLSSFPMPQIVLEPDDKDPIMDGVGVSDFYMPQVVKYPNAQDAYLMFPNPYLHYEDWYLTDDLSNYYSNKGKERFNSGPLDIAFAASRDGIDWQRYDRKPLISHGRIGELDDRGLYPVHGLIFHDDEVWLYYIEDADHFLLEEGSKHRNVMSRVVFRKDGFTAVEAAYTGGEFTTPALKFDGNELHLNIETSALGLARVEIQDDSGKQIPGYALDDCDRIHTTNSTRRAVSWRKGNSNIGGLAHTQVRFRFELRYGAKLYAFGTGDVAADMIQPDRPISAP